MLYLIAANWHMAASYADQRHLVHWTFVSSLRIMYEAGRHQYYVLVDGYDKHPDWKRVHERLEARKWVRVEPIEDHYIGILDDDD